MFKIENKKEITFSLFYSMSKIQLIIRFDRWVEIWKKLYFRETMLFASMCFCFFTLFDSKLNQK